MKQFLLFVSLAGAALYALLVYSHHTITEGRSERVPARQTQPNDPSAQRLSSWESHIRSSAPNSQPTAHLPSQQDAADELRRDPSQDLSESPADGTKVLHQRLSQPFPTQPRLGGLR